MSLIRHPDMKYKTLAEGERFCIDEFEMTREQVDQAKLEALLDMRLHDHYDTTPGTYRRLFDKQLEECVMSNTAMEWRTNREVIAQARGHVLIAGLGISMILPPILAKPEVKSVTVIEKFAEVFTLNQVSGLLPEDIRLKVVIGDIEDEGGRIAPETFDVIYFDIWNDVGSHNREQMERLRNKYVHALRPGGWINSWRYEESLDEVSEETKTFYRNLLRKNPMLAMILGARLRELKREEAVDTAG